MKVLDYLKRLILVAGISLVLCIIERVFQFSIVPMPQKDVVNYHIQVLTISSVFCGFSLTNLTLLIEVHDEKLIKKLKGTDILQKRNMSISYSILYGAISAFLSVFWVLRINVDLIKKIISTGGVDLLKEFFFNVEIVSLLLCIICFMISSKKMIDLVSLIHKPERKMSNQEVARHKAELQESENE